MVLVLRGSSDTRYALVNDERSLLKIFPNLRLPSIQTDAINILHYPYSPYTSALISDIPSNSTTILRDREERESTSFNLNQSRFFFTVEVQVEFRTREVLIQFQIFSKTGSKFFYGKG